MIAMSAQTGADTRMRTQRSVRLMLSALLRILTLRRSATELSSGQKGENGMNKKDLIDALSHLKVETGSLACLGGADGPHCGVR